MHAYSLPFEATPFPPLETCHCLDFALMQESFFKKLGNALPAIPAAVAQRKILPLLSQALEFGGEFCSHMETTCRQRRVLLINSIGHNNGCSGLAMFPCHVQARPHTLWAHCYRLATHWTVMSSPRRWSQHCQSSLLHKVCTGIC